MELEIIHADITTLDLDAIVNAANSGLLGGGGVDGAIHQAAGPGLITACRNLRHNLYPRGMPAGKAAVTGGFNLPARYVIHAVGPMYGVDPNHEKLLESAYTSSLDIAEGICLKSIAFPSISTGSFGYPFEESLNVVKKVMDTFEFNYLQRVVLCYFSENAKQAAMKIFGKQESAK